MLSFCCQVNCFPVNAAYIRENPVPDNLSQADRCISTDIRSKIQVFTALCIGFDPIMVMAVYIQAQGQAENRFVRQQDFVHPDTFPFHGIFRKTLQTRELFGAQK